MAISALTKDRHYNIVESIGYGNERVHTGFLIWILNPLRDSRTAKEALVRLWKMAETLPTGMALQSDDVLDIELFRQQARKMKIDLEVRAKLRTGKELFLGIEFKVDAGESGKQFDVFRNSYAVLANSGAAVGLLLVALGDGEFSIDPPAGWGFMGLSQALSFADEMANFLSLNDKKTWGVWKDALTFEFLRRESASNVVLDPKAPFLSKVLGYRVWGAYLSAYAKVRPQLEKRVGGRWCIYPVQGNAVMNLDDRWRLSRDNRLAVYWEFNDSNFTLKLDVKDQSIDSGQADVQSVVGRLRSFDWKKPRCPPPEIPKRRTGRHPTVLRWFDVLSTPDETAETVARILEIGEGVDGAIDRALDGYRAYLD